jgi:uncharacterized protein YbaP (TraB family)
MKKVSAGFLMSLWWLIGCTQKPDKIAPDNNTLLWKISGNGLSKPSYLFGTIHMLCADDALLSDHMKSIIRKTDEVYFEGGYNSPGPVEQRRLRKSKRLF